MIKAVAVALFVLATSSFAAESEYDRFKNVTTVKAGGSTGAMLVELASPQIIATFDGQTPPAKGSPLMFIFLTDGKDWKYLHCHDIAFLADGKPIAAGKSVHYGKVGSGYVIESMSTQVPRASAVQMARASTIEAQVCKTEYRFTDLDIENVRAVVRGSGKQ